MQPKHICLIWEQRMHLPFWVSWTYAHVLDSPCWAGSIISTIGSGLCSDLAVIILEKSQWPCCRNLGSLFIILITSFWVYTILCFLVILCLILLSYYDWTYFYIYNITLTNHSQSLLSHRLRVSLFIPSLCYVITYLLCSHSLLTIG